MSIYCPYCGKDLPDGSHFCSKCGKQIPDVNSKGGKIEATVSETINSERKSVIETTGEKNTPSNNLEFDATKKGKSIASLVLGILGVICLGGWLSLVFGVIGFCLGMSALKHRVGIRKMAIAGIVLSIIAVISRFVGVLIRYLIS